MAVELSYFSLTPRDNVYSLRVRTAVKFSIPSVALPSKQSWLLVLLSLQQETWLHIALRDSHGLTKLGGTVIHDAAAVEWHRAQCAIH